MSTAEQNGPVERRLEGIPLSPGIAMGRPCFHTSQGIGSGSRVSFAPADEIVRLRKSIERVSQQRSLLAEETALLLNEEHAQIFEAHRLILEDACLQEQLVHAINVEGCSAPEAVSRVFEDYGSQLAAGDSEYLRERAADVDEIRQALLGDLERTVVCRHCRQSNNCSIDHCRLGNDHILISSEIGASLPIETDSHTAGFVVDKAGSNSHAVILARALHRPVVGAIHNLPESIPAQAQILVDGDRGEVIVNPSIETLEYYRTCQTNQGPKIRRSAPVAGFRVMANISRSGDVDEALAAGAEGIGLYRTEMEMLAAGRPLGEDEQAFRYSKVVKAMAGRPVHIRLLDLHHDKNAGWTGFQESNIPSKGQEGQHLLLAQPELLRTQARALARASIHGPIQVVYPMISSVEQFLKIRKSFDEAISDVSNGELMHGVLFEVPAACLDAARVMRVADFGCIGSNDLIQYLFGVDRSVGAAGSHRGFSNNAVFWDLIMQLGLAASAARKPITLCGELASNPDFTCKLLDHGISATSTDPIHVATVRHAAEKCGR